MWSFSISSWLSCHTRQDKASWNQVFPFFPGLSSKKPLCIIGRTSVILILLNLLNFNETVPAQMHQQMCFLCYVTSWTSSWGELPHHIVLLQHSQKKYKSFLSLVTSSIPSVPPFFLCIGLLSFERPIWRPQQVGNIILALL